MCELTSRSWGLLIWEFECWGSSEIVRRSCILETPHSFIKD